MSTKLSEKKTILFLLDNAVPATQSEFGQTYLECVDFFFGPTWAKTRIRDRIAVPHIQSCCACHLDL